MARLARRSSLSGDRGALVATTSMIEPWPSSSSSCPPPSTACRKEYRSNWRPTGAPAMVRIPPKFDWTRTPTVNPPRLSGRTRLLVPIPPFQPNARVPRPAPTDPSATGPEEAISKASRTCAAVIGRLRMSFRPPSLASPTTAFRDRRPSMPSCSSAHSTRGSAAFQTHKVQVRRIGVSNSPQLAYLGHTEELSEAVAHVDGGGHSLVVDASRVRAG